MNAAGVKGPQATPKGLMHGFAVAAIQPGTLLNLLPFSNRVPVGSKALRRLVVYAHVERLRGDPRQPGAHLRKRFQGQPALFRDMGVCV